MKTVIWIYYAASYYYWDPYIRVYNGIINISFVDSRERVRRPYVSVAIPSRPPGRPGPPRIATGHYIPLYTRIYGSLPRIRLGFFQRSDATRTLFSWSVLARTNDSYMPRDVIKDICNHLRPLSSTLALPSALVSRTKASA